MVSLTFRSTASTCSSGPHTFIRAPIRTDDWHSATASHAPLLGGLRRTVSAISLASCFHHRDGSLRRGRRPQLASPRLYGTLASEALLAVGGKSDTCETSSGTEKIERLLTPPITRRRITAVSALTPRVDLRILWLGHWPAPLRQELPTTPKPHSRRGKSSVSLYGPQGYSYVPGSLRNLRGGSSYYCPTAAAGTQLFHGPPSFLTGRSTGPLSSDLTLTVVRSLFLGSSVTRGSRLDQQPLPLNASACVATQLGELHQDTLLFTCLYPFLIWHVSCLLAFCPIVTLKFDFSTT